MKLKISIITVVRNAPQDLERTLANLTALDTSAAAVELVVIDGASTDRTPEVIERYADRISYRVSEPDGGLYDAMNKGIRAATGDYLWFVNAGDTVYSTDTLTLIFGGSGFSEVTSAGAGASVPELSASGALADIYYGETVVVSASGEPLGLRKKRLPHGGLTWRSLEWGMVVCHQSFIVRRAIAPLYDTGNYRLAADIDWVIACLKAAREVRYTGLILSCFTTGGISTRRRKASWRERWRIMRHYYGLPRTLWAHVRFVWDVVLGRVCQKGEYRPLKGGSYSQ